VSTPTPATKEHPTITEQLTACDGLTTYESKHIDAWYEWYITGRVECLEGGQKPP
jgi:hypothetical protein